MDLSYSSKEQQQEISIYLILPLLLLRASDLWQKPVPTYAISITDIGDFLELSEYAETSTNGDTPYITGCSGPTDFPVYCRKAR